MKPRLLSSKRWTPFPRDLLSQIEEALLESFPTHFQKARLILEGRLFPEEIMLRIGYLEKGRLVQNNFEASVPYESETTHVLSEIHRLADATTSLISDFIQNEGEIDLPRSWTEYSYEGRPIWVQYSTVNTDLEKAADELLGLTEERLVFHEDQADEDALSHSGIVPPFFGKGKKSH